MGRSSTSTSVAVLVTCLFATAWAPLAHAREDEDGRRVDEPSLLDDANRDLSVGCAALDTFGSVKGEAEGGPELNWAAWGCWFGGVAGMMCTPAGAAVGAPAGAAFGMVVGSLVDKTDVALVSLWAIPAILLGVVMTGAGTVATVAILYTQGLVIGNPLQENAFIVGASVASVLIAAGALVTGPLAMASLAHGLHAQRSSSLASTRPEQGLRLVDSSDDAMLE